MFVNKSNLLYFFLLLPLYGAICSCSSDSVDINDIVPYRKIDVNLNLDYHNELTNNTAIYFDDVYGQQVGYKNHGIIVFRANDQYYAYDATCTNDVESIEHVELNDPDDQDAWEGVAVCPVCKSEFLIQNGAFPINESVAKYPLKSYRTSKSGNMLRIYN
jgi:nitrite reductase/ring-hydroxylating ferredoxin subunit